ncbi:hypothetical protein Tco_0020522 [Tanacetum coccineum]
MIPLICVQEAFEGESAQGFDLPVYFWQRVTVLRACFVEVFKINTHSLTIVTLLYHHQVEEPIVIMNLPHDPDCHKLINLIIDCYVPFCGLASFLLPSRLTTFSYIQPMFRYLPWNARHIRWSPSEYVPKLSESEPIITVCSGCSGLIATFTLSSFTLLTKMGCSSGPKTITHSTGIILLSFSVSIPPMTGNFIIPCAVDGTACIFCNPGLLMIPLCRDVDLTTMKSINADIECSSSPIFTKSVICPNGYFISPLNPISEVVAGTI